MDIKSLIDDAEKLHEAKKYNEAIKKLDEALSKTKNNDNTYYYIDALRHIGHLYFTICLLYTSQCCLCDLIVQP